jgi:zinc protease
MIFSSLAIRLISASTFILSSPFAFAQAPPAAKATPAPAPAAGEDVGSLIKFPVEKYQLPNGLTVLLHEDHSVPTISYQTWFRVGSKNEEVGFTGIAHLFEHMMFKGAKRYTGEQFDQMLQANGATNNAFTTQDYTGYYENLPSAKLELVMDIESDRMENLQITEENLKSEREVVKEERRFRVDNNPMGILRETLFGTTFRVHSYRWPVIGYMKDLDNISLQKANDFYRTYYAPNNATLVIAGDFEAAAAKRLIEKYYGALKSQTIPEAKIPPEPKQTSSRSQFISHDVQTTQFALSYPTTKAGTDDSYALDLLANMMGNGMSSRLYQRLVYKEQNVASVAAYNLTLQDSGQFQIYATMKPGQNYAQAERAIMGELWRPRNLLAKPEELQKAKNQVMKSYVDSLKTIHGKAEALAMNETLFRNYEELFKDLDRYNKVTPQKIREVAQKYLGPNQATLVVLKPKAPARRGR